MEDFKQFSPLPYFDCEHHFILVGFQTLKQALDERVFGILGPFFFYLFVGRC